MKSCPLKWQEKSFKENAVYFFHGKDSSSFNPRIICKNVFSHWTSTDLEIWVKNSVSAIQHIENRKFY